MRFNVAQLLKEGVGATRHVEIVGSIEDIDENNPGPIPITGHIDLVRTPAGVLAMGVAHLRLVQGCSRCLELTTRDMALEIEEEFVPALDILTGAPLPLADADSPELAIDEAHILDMTEVLRQYAVVAAAGFNLCRPDCKGLCSECGANLNLGECGCDRSRIDPRFASLASLLDADRRNE